MWQLILAIIWQRMLAICGSSPELFFVLSHPRPPPERGLFFLDGLLEADLDSLAAWLALWFARACSAKQERHEKRG